MIAVSPPPTFQALAIGCLAMNAIHIFTRRKRSALEITDTELKLMATAAISGESSKPVKG
ncbi:MAG: hypothetical protein PHD68_09330 [Rugosibacter sp.]|nr:hypothetical protein [Rugosibacter sp.]